MSLITEAIVQSVHERYNAGVEAQKGYVAYQDVLLTKFMIACSRTLNFLFRDRRAYVWK